MNDMSRIWRVPTPPPDRSLREAYTVTTDAMACNLLDPDAAEGIDAFLEKRGANWGGTR